VAECPRTFRYLMAARLMPLLGNLMTVSRDFQ
jgi:hypothetical protein